ncbi:hypothetical protein MPER_01570 [Moniliophthora perniciosa FA553]|nr:hypothetical protein MPER_01570 [Moniliophthora perniciosa FA553]
MKEEKMALEGRAITQRQDCPFALCFITTCSMECKNCELVQRQFFCANCIRAHSQNYRIQTTHFASDLSEQKSKATKALVTIEPNRIRRAQRAVSAMSEVT